MEIIYYIRKHGTQQILSKKKDEHGNWWFKMSRGNPIGVVVSNGYNSVGWSLVNEKHDHFDKKEALRLARENEINGDVRNIPKKAQEAILIVLERSRKVNFDK